MSDTIGNSIIFKGDCLEIMDKLIEKGVKVDAIITDPPYGTTACKWDSVIPFDKMWSKICNIIKMGGAIVLFGSEPFSSQLRVSNLKMYKYDWIWHKNTSSNFLQSNYQPRKIHEIISVFSNGTASYTKNNTKMKYNPQMWGENKIYSKKETSMENNLKSWQNNVSKNYKIKSTNTTGKRFPESILNFGADKDKLHPTQKPVDLLEYLIKTYTNENEVVLDFTMGSGSTGIACQNTNRKFIGIELEEKYYNIAKNRLLENLENINKEK